VALLEQYLASNSSQHTIKDKKSGKLKKRKGQYNPVTIMYLVERAWGSANNFLACLRTSGKEKAAQAFGEDSSNLILIAPEFEDGTDEPKDVMTVINSFDNASRTYTVKYLFAIHSC
jgi:hypothetical protein